jgi:hypothetical protein
MSFKDKTFCASPGCTGKCGRKMTHTERSQLRGITKMIGKAYPVAYAYFCGEPNEQVTGIAPVSLQGRE